MEAEQIKISLKDSMHLKAVRLIHTGAYTKTDLAKRLEISRTTLDTRLDKMNWKIGELYVLKSI